MVSQGTLTSQQVGGHHLTIGGCTSRSCTSALWTANCRSPASSWIWCICGEGCCSEDHMLKIEKLCLCSHTKTSRPDCVSSFCCCKGLSLRWQEHLRGVVRGFLRAFEYRAGMLTMV